MPRSAAKTVLFARAKVDGKIQQRPVAVFPNDMTARSYALHILTAHRSQDTAALKSLGVAWLVPDTGTTVGDLKFSRAELPYAPDPVTSEEDPFADDKPATS